MNDMKANFMPKEMTLFSWKYLNVILEGAQCALFILFKYFPVMNSFRWPVPFLVHVLIGKKILNKYIFVICICAWESMTRVVLEVLKVLLSNLTLI